MGIEAPNEEGYDESVSGAMLLKQVAPDRLADRVAYSLSEQCTPQDVRNAVQWLKDSGCTDELVYQDDNGFLMRRYDEDYGWSYEWHQGPILLVLNEGYLESWGHPMLKNYDWEVVAQWER